MFGLDRRPRIALALALACLGISAPARAQSNGEPKSGFDLASQLAGAATCEKPTPPRRIEGKSPRLTRKLKRAHVQGKVSVTGHIGKDGSVSDLRVVESADVRLNPLVLDAVKAWRFEPARCSGKPVSVPLQVTLDVRK